MTVDVFSENEYNAQEYDAVLVRERSVVCVEAESGDVRVIPLSKVNHLDGHEDDLLTGARLPEWFHGGGQYGFVDVESFPEVRDHLEELERETV